MSPACREISISFFMLVSPVSTRKCSRWNWVSSSSSLRSSGSSLGRFMSWIWNSLKLHTTIHRGFWLWGKYPAYRLACWKGVSIDPSDWRDPFLRSISSLFCSINTRVEGMNPSMKLVWLSMTGTSNSINWLGFSTPRTFWSKSIQNRWVSCFSSPCSPQ